MNHKQFVIEFEFDERTRWINEEERIKETLSVLLRTVGELHTEGARPRVTVLSIDCSPISPGGLLCGELK